MTFEPPSAYPDEPGDRLSILSWRTLGLRLGAVCLAGATLAGGCVRGESMGEAIDTSAAKSMDGFTAGATGRVGSGAQGDLAAAEAAADQVASEQAASGEVGPELAATSEAGRSELEAEEPPEEEVPTEAGPEDIAPSALAGDVGSMCATVQIAADALTDGEIETAASQRDLIIERRGQVGDPSLERILDAVEPDEGLDIDPLQSALFRCEELGFEL